MNSAKYSPRYEKSKPERVSPPSTQESAFTDHDNEDVDSNTIVIPFLNINQNSWVNNNLTYTHERNEDIAQVHMARDQAFNEWLAAKL